MTTPSFAARRCSEDLLFQLPLRMALTQVHDHSAWGETHSGEPVTIIEAPRLAGPRAVVIDAIPAAWQPGQQLLVGSSADADLCIDAETATVVTKLPLAPVNQQALQGVAHIVDGVLALFSPAESLAARIAAGDAFGERCAAFVDSLAAGRVPELKMLGYGSGLTPSSDDWMTGLLSTLQSQQCREAHLVEQWLAPILDDPSSDVAPVSRMMLTAAQRQDYPEVVVAFWANPSHETALDFLGHGATSGADLLLGISAGAHLIDQMVN